MTLTNLSEVRELLTRHGFTFSKALGQNFIVNPTVCPRIASEGGAADVGVIEIGPGIGTLTSALCEVAKKVVAVELDDRLPPILAETLAAYNNVTIVPGDAMEIDFAALIAEHFAGMQVVICANLPYYITSPLLMRLLELRLPVESITVMVQKEAAERICAKPGTRECGAVSAAVWYYAEPKPLFNVSRGSFVPAPNVDSRVIRLDIRETPYPVADEKAFFRMVRAAFGQRRKTLANALAAGLPFDKTQIAAAIERAGLPPAVRAEALTMEQLAALCEQLFA